MSDNQASYSVKEKFENENVTNTSDGKKDKIEEEYERSFWEFIKEKTHEAFVLNIPSDSVQEMEPKYRYPLGIFLHMTSLAMFILFFVLGMNDQMTSPYLTLYDSDLAGGKASQAFYDSFTQKRCQNVSNPITGTFFSTQSGLWENDPGFSYTNATYYMEVSQWDDNDQSSHPWSVLIVNVAKTLQRLGNYMKTQNFGYNMLVWTTWYTTDPSRGTAQVFGLTGSLKTVLKRQKISASISSAYGVCDEPLTASFDSSTATASVSFNYDSFMKRPKCFKALSNITSTFFGYQQYLDGPTMSLSFDMQTLAVALSINLNINSLTDFDEIVDARVQWIDFMHVKRSIRTYTSSRFPNMRPITCSVTTELESRDPNAICIMRAGNGVLIPFWNHFKIPYGNDNIFSYPFVPLNFSYFPPPCNCSKNNTRDIGSPQITDSEVLYNTCNSLSFLSGVMYWNSAVFYPDPVILIFAKLNSVMLNQGLYHANYLSTYFGVEYMKSINDTQQTSLQRAFSICDLGPPAGGCSIIQFATYDMIPSGVVDAYGVSKNLFTLFNGSCRDSISMSDETLQTFLDNPFAELVQAYMTCLDPVRTMLLNNLGISTGNVGCLLPIGVAFLLVCVHIYSHFTDKKVFFDYSAVKVKGVLEQLALLLLLHKEGKLESRLEEFKGLLLKDKKRQMKEKMKMMMMKEKGEGGEGRRDDGEEEDNEYNNTNTSSTNNTNNNRGQK